MVLATDDDLALAMELTDRAAELSLPAFGRPDRQTETKSDGSPVTETDREVETLLRDLLGDRRPSDHVVGEEYGGAADAARCWYLDPIDGTANFVEGSDRWSTLVSLVVDGMVTIGVIDFPARKKRFWATRGGGAFADGRQMRVSTTDRLSEATVCDDYRHHIERHISEHPLVHLAAHCLSVHPHQGHSMLALADGSADVALASSGGPWDFAPFVVLIAEAGGRTSDVTGGSRFDTGSLLATNGRLHDEALAVLGLHHD